MSEVIELENKAVVPPEKQNELCQVMDALRMKTVL